MRLERLLRIVALLQSRGRMTAGELAERLEVSVRTIQRDLDALSGAGVPVYALRGGDGGWELSANYRTALAGLTGEEARAIVAGRPRILADLGLDDPADRALMKFMAALPASARAVAEHARLRVLVDVSPWGSKTRPSPALARLQEAIWRDRVVRLRYGASGRAFAAMPLGLVAKGMVWYLVAQRDGELRTYRVSRIADVTVTDEAAERPREFDLEAHWEQVSTRLADTWPTYVATLRVRGDAMNRLRWSGARIETVTPRRKPWSEVRIDLENEHEARAVVLSLGADVEVVAPKELRRHARDEARAFASRNQR